MVTNTNFSLHPALLMASGYESIDSRDAKLLNAYRAYFGSYASNGHQTHIIKPADFIPGGICNPHGHLDDENMSYIRCMGKVRNFPYLTYQEIEHAFYQEPIREVMQRVLNELYDEIEAYLLDQKLPYSFLQPTTEVITFLNSSPLYRKITALHLCGMGEKLKDSFGLIFRQFKQLRVVHQ